MTDQQHADECAGVLARIQEFIDNELDDATEDQVRAHLACCEPCLDTVDGWVAVRELVKRAYRVTPAPRSLVSRVTMTFSSVRFTKPL